MIAQSSHNYGTDKRYPFSRSWRWYFVRLFDFFFDPFSKRFHQSEFPKSVKNILVIRLDQIGDLVCSLPVFRILKRRFPDAKITTLVGQEGKAVLDQNPFIDRLIVFRSNWFSRNRWANPLEFFQVFSELRKTQYDLGFDLRGDLRNIVLMTLAGVRYRIGYGIAGGGGLLHKAYEYDQSLHQVELNLKLVTDESVQKVNLKPEIHLTPDEKNDALRRLRDFGIQEKARLIAIHPEAGYPSKEWGEHKFKQLIEGLLTDSQSQILIFGLSRANKIAEHFSSSNRVINLVDKLSLRKMIAVLSRCHLFIGNDSGPSHIAQALGIPAVVIASGQNEYDKWGIWTEPSRILKHQVPCSPCHLRYCNVEGHPCMSRISVEGVFQAAQGLSAGARS